MPRLLTFDTTHHALLAEQIAHENGLAAEVTPAPPGAVAKCDLAIEYLMDEEAALLRVLGEAGVQFRVYEA